jgi:hypothetical protein
MLGAESQGQEVTMFDQQGIWAMNQAHHQDLLEVAAKRRLLKTIRSHGSVTLEMLRKVVPVRMFVSGVVRWRRQWLVEQGLVR